MDRKRAGSLHLLHFNTKARCCRLEGLAASFLNFVPVGIFQVGKFDQIGTKMAINVMAGKCRLAGEPDCKTTEGEHP